ncbi:FtsX-like permease family protein [Rhizomonospora bruguierae]|uniref:FtsX-like permease family protein n=1 Tax=Rhizomonospora bruguierae TaxID=1581705 RepID=UPI0020BE98BE|nr:FtsX-like permease family protein [Micromonospora sp. NBRC 107566]
MSPLTLVRLALAGSRTDTLRVVLTAASAAVATPLLLLSAAVIAIPGFGQGHRGSDSWAEQYRLQVLVEPGLRPGVVITLVLMTIPVLALAAQCGRLGAPARDRRLAAIRLAGATPGQAVRLAAAETGLASALGSAAGLAGYLILRRALGRPGADGRLLLPTDVLPATWALVAICAGLPLLATAVAMLLLRRVAFTPYGVVRRSRNRPPGPYAGILIVIGAVAMAVLQPGFRWAERIKWSPPGWVLPAILFVGTLCAALGVVLGTGWISYTAGRILRRYGRRPAALLAGSRLMADPWSGSRTFAVLLICVLFGAGAAGARSWFATDFAVREEAGRWQAAQAGQPYYADDNSFYFTTLDLINGAVAFGVALAAAGMLVAVVEGIVSRRRAYSSLVATGVPRGVLARSIVLQAVAPVVPAVLVAAAVGVTLIHAIAGGSVRSANYESSSCTSADCTTEVVVHVPSFVRQIPVPLADLALLGGLAVAAALAVVGVGLLFLRPATAVEELRTT